MFREQEKMTVEVKEKVRGGIGTPVFRHLFSAAELGGRADMMAVVTLEPGESIGPHSHSTNAEAYYLLEGSATVLEDGTERELMPGDAEFCADGHIHAIRNHTQAPARFLALILPDRH